MSDSLPTSSGGARWGIAYDPEVLPGDVRVSAEVKTDETMGNFQLWARRINRDLYPDYYYTTLATSGRLAVGKSAGSVDSFVQYFTETGLTDPYRSYFMELTVTDHPVLNVPEIVGRVFDEEGGTLLLEARLFDTNLLGVEPYRSGMAGVLVSPAGSNPLNAGIDNIRAQTIPEPSTIALLLAGAVCLLGIAWWRRGV
jgi:hypothetical protein